MLGRVTAAHVGIAPIMLHTGVASLEEDELPYAEGVLFAPSITANVNAALKQVA